MRQIGQMERPGLVSKASPMQFPIENRIQGIRAIRHQAADHQGGKVQPLRAEAPQRQHCRRMCQGKRHDRGRIPSHPEGDQPKRDLVFGSASGGTLL